jgi:hypothetical protein
MSVLAASFRIAREGDYNERYNSLVTALRKESIDSVSEETTSFILIKSNKSAEAVAQSAYLGSSMNDRDVLLIVDLSYKSSAIKGENKYPNTLAALLDARKGVPRQRPRRTVRLGQHEPSRSGAFHLGPVCLGKGRQGTDRSDAV